MNKFQRKSLDDERWWVGVTPNAKKHLLGSLENLDEGVPPTPSFKLYGKSDWTVVTDFLQSVSSDPDIPEWLLEYEYSREEKFGPQGGHAPWAELEEDAELYFTRVSDCSESAEIVDEYAALGCKMLGVKEALDTLKSENKILTRASGWRAFNLKKTNEVAQHMALNDVLDGNWRNGWAYFFSRYNKKKKRLFIPMPFSSMIGQAQYFHPMLSAIQENLRANKSASPFRFWGDKIGFGPLFHDVMEPLLQGVNPSHLVYIMRDFEKMDTTTGPEQKGKLFIPKLAAALGIPTGSGEYQRMVDFILFSNLCPIATPAGMWVGSHGEASGATVTNGGETCCNEEYDNLFRKKLDRLCRENGIIVKWIGSFGNGDDGISLYELNDVADFDLFQTYVRSAAQESAEELGFIIQADKWDIHLASYGKYCQYLVDWNSFSLRAMYPASLALNSIVNPEKQYTKAEWDKDYEDINVIMKLTPCQELPYFHKLVDYVDNGMKYRLLGRSEKATRRILSKWDKYYALRDSSLDFNRWDLSSGLQNNAVVKYLLDKRGWKVK